VRRFTARALREGGDESVDGLVRLVGAHGVDALRAADNVSSIPHLLRSINELPTELVGPALRRLSGTEGRILADMMERYGSAALRAEATHPGIGIRAMSSLGQDGAGLVVRMNRNQAFTVGRHLDDIAALPAAQKKGVIDLIYRDMERVAQFMGRFVENNPGKVLFTASTTAVILNNPDSILGGGEVVFDSEGNPHFVSSPGTIERIAKPMVDTARMLVIPVIAAALGVYFGIRIWFYFRRRKKEYEEWIREKNRISDEAEEKSEDCGKKKRITAPDIGRSKSYPISPFIMSHWMKQRPITTWRRPRKCSLSSIKRGSTSWTRCTGAWCPSGQRPPKLATR